MLVLRLALLVFMTACALLDHHQADEVVAMRNFYFLHVCHRNVTMNHYNTAFMLCKPIYGAMR